MDAPSGVRKEERAARVGGAHGVAFHGFDARMGLTYEVWFIRDGLLYEISSARIPMMARSKSLHGHTDMRRGFLCLGDKDFPCFAL